MEISMARIQEIGWTAGSMFGDEEIKKLKNEIAKLATMQQIYEAAIKKIKDEEKAAADAAKEKAEAERTAEENRIKRAERLKAIQAKKIADEKAAADAAKTAAADAKKLEEDKFKTIVAFSTAAHEMQTDQFQLQREQLARDVMDWKAAGVLKTDIDRIEAEKRKQIAADEFKFKLAKANEIVNAVANLANQMVSLDQARIDRELENQTSAEQRGFEEHKARITEQFSIDGKITEEGLEKIGELEQSHQASLANMRDEADRQKRRAAKRAKPIKMAQAVSNTALAVTEALPNIPLAVLIGALGAAEVATIAAQPFAKGGIVNRPTYFSHGAGLGIMGEVPGRSEAIMPLARGSNGELGVQASGSGGNTYIVEQHNVFQGIAPERWINDTVAPTLEDGARKGMNDLMTQKIYNRLK
jgi:chemotaxis protein histidine kinase CheA